LLQHPASAQAMKYILMRQLKKFMEMASSDEKEAEFVNGTTILL
jgi:hypothetical protein